MLPQDKCNVSTNDNRAVRGLPKISSLQRGKGMDRGVHISDWICEPSGRLALLPEQVAAQMLLLKPNDCKFLTHKRSSTPVKGTMPGVSGSVKGANKGCHRYI